MIDYVVTSPKDPCYNCIAFAAADPTRKWDPGMLPEPGYYWPSAALRDDDNDDIEALKRAFAQIGYEDCANGDLEVGWQKVALYALEEDDWLHAAVQEQNGEWSSKLGAGYDIRHKTPHCLEGPVYGKVICFMKKRRSPGGQARDRAGAAGR